MGSFALMVCSKNELIHFYLKLKNMLLVQKPNLYVKLTDFKSGCFDVSRCMIILKKIIILYRFCLVFFICINRYLEYWTRYC